MAFGTLLLLIGAVTFLTSSREDHKAAKNVPVAEVRITRQGFEPSTLVVKRGTKITWSNADSGLHQVASNQYPTDKDLPGLKSEILNNAQTYTYVANTTGSFGYHDQMKPTINGTLVIQK